MTLCRYFPTLCRLADTRRAGVCCRTEEATTTSTTAAPVLAPRCGEVSFSVETEDRDNVQFPGAKAYNIGCRLRFDKCIVTKHPPRKFETTQLSLRISNVQGWPGTVTVTVTALGGGRGRARWRHGGARVRGHAGQQPARAHQRKLCPGQWGHRTCYT